MRPLVISVGLVGAGLTFLSAAAFAVWTYVPPQGDAVTFFSPGAAGRILFPVVGAALVAIGLFAYWRSRKRGETERTARA